MKKIGLVAAIAALFVAAPAYCQKDTVVLKGGDTLHGEIKKLEKDVLYFDTDYADEVFRIEWEDVLRIESDRNFLMETYGGQRLSGHVRPDEETTAVPTPAPAPEPKAEPKPSKLIVLEQGAETELGLPDVTVITPVDESVWSRFDGGFGGGLSFTKANSSQQMNLDAHLTYQSAKRYAAERFNVIFNTIGSGEDEVRTNRWESDSSYRHFIGDRWYAIGGLNFFHSSEQELDLRTTLQGGIGRYVFRSPSQYLLAGGGLAWTNERYLNSDEVFNSAEAWGGFEFYTERLKFADFRTNNAIFPSLTRSGRYRITSNSSLEFNLPGDWDFMISFYDNFDSAPLIDAPKNDYGFVTSFGWSP